MLSPPPEHLTIHFYAGHLPNPTFPQKRLSLLLDSFLYADDVKLSAPRNSHYIHQNPLNLRVRWSKDWEIDLNPAKSEHLSIGNSSHFVTYTLPS